MQKIIVNEQVNNERSTIFSVQRDDSPLRTLFGYGKSKNVPGFHQKAPSTDVNHDEMLQKYIRYSTNISDSNATRWQ